MSICDSLTCYSDDDTTGTLLTVDFTGVQPLTFVTHGAREQGHRVGELRRVAVAVARKVEGHHPEPLRRERGRLAPPHRAAAGPAVDEHEG